ncbi:MAG TPA: hypothetical protein VMA95_15990 [Streptosporangiaceae bacterium]|nr:hypothetical protein [Streptosporangiaceae bacterium]
MPGDLPVVPALSEFLRWSGSSPVAAINVSRYRCDALVLADGAIACVPLPELSPGALARQAALLDRALARARHEGGISDPGGPNDDVSLILEWLWDSIARPVLTQLGRDGPLGETSGLPRVFWMPTGALCRLPLHAAGYHREGGGRTVLDRVVSSYTATVGALRLCGAGAHVRVAGQGHEALARAAASSPEPLHLTSALQFTGSCQVVGALWDGQDSSLYERVTQAGGSPARTLHEAVRALRDDGRAPLPLTWAGYVHVGC